MEANFYERVLNVQADLKAPKGQYNSFGKYNYRSCEDILEAVKPLLAKNMLLMTITDEPISIGGRFYIKATVTVHDALSEMKLSVAAYAREAEEKKGMDEAQVTGSASSYSRKYALNGMFLIDDTKDDDTREPSDASNGKTPSQNASEKPQRGRYDNIKALKAEALELGIKEEGIKSYIDERFKKPLPEFTNGDIKAFEVYLASLIADKKALDAARSA